MHAGLFFFKIFPLSGSAKLGLGGLGKSDVQSGNMLATLAAEARTAGIKSSYKVL